MWKKLSLRLILKGKGNFRCYAALDFSGKFSSWKKCPTRVKNGQKTCFFHFLKNFVTTFNWKRSSMKDENVFRFLLHSLYLVKFLFLSYSPKCSQSISLQEIPNLNISRTIWRSSWFFACSYTPTELKKDYVILGYDPKYSQPI